MEFLTLQAFVRAEIISMIEKNFRLNDHKVNEIKPEIEHPEPFIPP